MYIQGGYVISREKWVVGEDVVGNPPAHLAQLFYIDKSIY